MSASDHYKRLQETNDRKDSNRNSASISNRDSHESTVNINPVMSSREPATGPASQAGRQSASEPSLPQTSHKAGRQTGASTQRSAEEPPPSGNPSNPRVAQMLKVLRESEARYKRKAQRDATIGIGDIVIVLSGPYADAKAQVCDLDYINSVAMVERVGTGQRLWLNLSNLAPSD